MREVQVCVAVREKKRSRGREGSNQREMKKFKRGMEMRVDEWRACNREDDERENHDRLILELSETLLFIVL